MPDELDLGVQIRFEKLEVEDGDIIIAKLDKEISAPCADRILKTIRRIINKDIRIIFLPPGLKLFKVDEKILNNWGWYKTTDATRPGEALKKPEIGTGQEIKKDNKE